MSRVERRAGGGAALIDLVIAAYRDGVTLGEASALAQEAVAHSRQRQDREAEGFALVTAALVELEIGAFTTSERLLDIADDAFEEVAAGAPAGRSISAAGRAVVAALRGERFDAERHFTTALELAIRAGPPRATAMVLALRSEHTATVDPRRAIADARRVEDLCGRRREPFWACAERGQAAAAAALGQFRAAEATLEGALEHSLPPVERGRTLAAVGDVRAAAGDRTGASHAFDDAAELFTALGARYQLFRALQAHAVVAPRRRTSLLTRAAPLFVADPAYELVRGRAVLEVRVLGNPAVALDGMPIAFASSKALLLVCALATSPSRSLHREALIDRLWPHAAAERASASLRTAIWEARRALGAEAWRLQRRGELVILDLEGAVVDLLDLRAEAQALLTSRAPDVSRIAEVADALQRPVVAVAAYEDWVITLDDDRLELLARMRAREQTLA